MKTLIKNGRVVTAVDDYTADILIEGETISVIGKTLDMEADKVIDAAGKLVIPGGIDPHTHMELPFGGTSIVRRFLYRHACGGIWRDDDDHRFCRAEQGRVADRRASITGTKRRRENAPSIMAFT